MYYALKNKEVIKVSRIEFARFFRNHQDSIVKQTKIPPYFISTVFLGLDHNIFQPGEPPIVFETMIFKDGDEWNTDYLERCATYKEAEAQHEKALELILKRITEQ